MTENVNHILVVVQMMSCHQMDSVKFVLSLQENKVLNNVHQTNAPLIRFFYQMVSANIVHNLKDHQLMEEHVNLVVEVDVQIIKH